MNLTNPLAYFDVETTGLSIKNDRIIEIAIIKINIDGSRAEFYSKINPEGKEMTEEAISKHGITSEMLEKEPTFKELATVIFNFIDGCDLGGFNCARFDIPILIEEFIRARIGIKASAFKIVDVYKILMKADPRTLSATYKRFTGKDLTGAHQAMSDIEATIDIMDGIEREFEIPQTAEELHSFSLGDDMIDFSGKLKKNADGKIILNFGKYKDQLVTDVYPKDPGYFKWILSTDLSQHTRTIFLTIIDILEKDK